ncbi:MAG: type II secretion system F family protein [Candidatus Omnitrophota bacterium]
MPAYKYRAKKGPAEIIEGIVRSPDRESAIEAVNAMGYTPLRVEESAPASRQASAENLKDPSGRARVRDVALFSGQLARLIKTGVPILRALEIIADQTDSPYLAAVINRITNDIKTGNTLSSAMAKHEKVFSPLYIATIKAGEDAGSLPVVLERTGDYLRRQDELFSKIRTALVYPAFMASVGLATVLFMLTFVIPRIKTIYAGMGEQLPLPTKILIGISAHLLRDWPIIAGTAVGLFFLVRMLVIRQRDIVDAFKLKIPFYGKFILRAELGRVVSSIALSIKNGIGILKAIELALPIASNGILRRELKGAYDTVRQGGSFGSHLKRSKVVPAFMANLIIIGEESGRLDEMLSEIADYFQRDIDDTIKIFAAQFEPILILVIGLVLGSIVIAVLLPIFQINVIAR